MRKFLIFALIIVSTPAFPREVSHVVDCKFNFESVDGIYDFEIRAVPQSRIKIPKNTRIIASKRTVNIECLNKCSCKDNYRESIGIGSGWPTGAGLLGAFLVQDGSRHLVTTWLTGQTYKVVIYGCEGGHLGKVLSIDSRSLPVVAADKSGMPVIKYLSDANSEITVQWDGNTYHELLGLR